MKNRQKPHVDNTPINTIEQAKAYFEEMGFSHYGMVRDYPQKYEEYKRLNISTQTETAWKKERFDELYNAIMRNTDDDAFSELFNNMCYLFESLKTEAELMTLLDVAKFIRDKVRYKDRVIIAETINGRAAREARSGLIYAAIDMGRISVAKEFADLSLHFSSYIDGETRGLERCQASTKLCKEIMLELGL